MQPILCLVLGTRGDVQPLALLAESLSVDKGFQVTFVTHVAHQVSSPMTAPHHLSAMIQRPAVNPTILATLILDPCTTNVKGMAPGSSGARAGDYFVDRRTASWSLGSVAGFVSTRSDSHA